MTTSHLNPIQGSGSLLPCPFCGHVGLDFAEGSTFRWIEASCGGCGATRGETRIQTLGEGTKEEWMAQARLDAIAEWNQRSAPTPQAPCATCGGARLVDDGEINHYSDGTPYLNGPVKCVKDCPECTDHEAAAIEQDRSIARAKDSGVYDRVRDNAALRDQIQYSGSAL